MVCSSPNYSKFHKIDNTLFNTDDPNDPSYVDSDQGEIKLSVKKKINKYTKFPQFLNFFPCNPTVQKKNKKKKYRKKCAKIQTAKNREGTNNHLH